MRETLWIALSSFRETVRDKILYTLLFFVLLLLAFSVLLGDWSVFAQKKVITDFSLGVMSIGGLAIAIFIGVGLVQKEIQRKTILTLLSKPVRRWQFLVGKYLGLLLVLVVNVLVMMAGLWAALAFSGNAFDPRLWLAAYGVFLEMAVITAVALLFSSFSTPVVSSLLTFAVFLASHLSGGILEYIETMKRNAKMIPGAQPLPAWFEGRGEGRATRPSRSGAVQHPSRDRPRSAARSWPSSLGHGPRFGLDRRDPRGRIVVVRSPRLPVVDSCRAPIRFPRTDSMALRPTSR